MDVHPKIAESNCFYRFRSPNALLRGFHELERQEIYFASLRELNDPMEGIGDLYWRGDQIVWRNLVKHYILYVTQCFILAPIFGDDFSEESVPYLVEWTRSTLQTDSQRMTHDSICRKFFSKLPGRRAPHILGSYSHKVRRDELLVYLKLVHFQALPIILEELSKRKLSPFANGAVLAGDRTMSTRLLRMIAYLNTLKISTYTNQNAIDEQFSGLATSYMEMDFNSTDIKSAAGRLKSRLIFDLPFEYVRRLNRVASYPWYAACFVKSESDSSMWGNYADGHRGVCLKFQAEQPSVGVNPYLRMSGKNIELVPMVYSDRLPEIDFFCSIAKLNEQSLKEDWYSDEKGNLSTSYHRSVGRIDSWRDEYWLSQRKLWETKLADWQHEQEHRAILFSVFFSENDDIDKRKLKYDFSSLVGITFGMNCKQEDKREIYEIVKRKCRFEERGQFDFRQAVYSHASGRIVSHSLGRLKV